jgi:hypothetical protein
VGTRKVDFGLETSLKFPENSHLLRLNFTAEFNWYHIRVSFSLIL